jgi:basic membrane protein A
LGVAATTVSASAAAKFKACVVTDTGGINDKSFNASAWAGLKDARAKDKNISVQYLSSTSSADYAPNINTFISKGCGIIVTVGFLMDAATSSPCSTRPTRRASSAASSPRA